MESNKRKIINEFLSLVDRDNRMYLTEKLLNKQIVSIFEDKELMATVNSFFDNNLNISETSRDTFMHRNTLIYRIEKIHKITGLNIRLLNDAVDFIILKGLYFNLKK